MPQGHLGAVPGLGCRDAGGSKTGPAGLACSVIARAVHVDRRTSQSAARIGCPNGGMRSGCCKPLFQHPGLHAGRETSTAGGHRLHRRDCPRSGGGMRQAEGGGPSAWVGRTGRLGCRDIFRFDQDGNVVERWDVLQTTPPAVSQRPHHFLTVTSVWRSVAGLLPGMAVRGNAPDEPHARRTRPQRRVTGHCAVRIRGRRAEPGRLPPRPRPRG